MYRKRKLLMITFLISLLICSSIYAEENISESILHSEEKLPYLEITPLPIPEFPQEMTTTPEGIEPVVPVEALPPLAVEFTRGMDWFLKFKLSQTWEEEASSILPYYSLDGVDFLPVYDETDSKDNDWIENPSNIYMPFQPVQGFLDKDFTQFWIKAKIVCPSGEFFSQTVHIKQEEGVEAPAGSRGIAGLPPQVRTGNGIKIRGNYHVTVREGCTLEELQSMLPTTLPIAVQVYGSDGQMLAEDKVDYTMDWNLSFLEGKFPIEKGSADFAFDGVKLIPPQVATLWSPAKIYFYTDLPLLETQTSPTTSIPTPFDLIVSVLEPDKKAVPMLSIANNGYGEVPSFSLTPKPTGAVRIVPEYSMDGGSTWNTAGEDGTEDVIALGKPVDAWPKNETYTAPLLLDSNRSPMKEFLSEEISGFLVRLHIQGGVYHGVSEVATWPAEYEYIPPPQIDSGNNGGGNRGDVGSGDTGTEGKRENLPEVSETIGLKITATAIEIEAIISGGNNSQDGGEEASQKVFTETDESAKVIESMEENREKITSAGVFMETDQPPSNSSGGGTTANATAILSIVLAGVAVCVLFATGIFSRVLLKLRIRFHGMG